MKRKSDIHEIFAVLRTEDHDRFTMDGDSLYDCHDTCIIWNEFEFYGVREDLTDEQADAVSDGDYSSAEKIGNLRGCLILCGQMIDEGEDPYIICDDEHADLEYTISALRDLDGPLEDDPAQNVFYIDEFSCDTKKIKAVILKRLPWTILKLMHVLPDILAFYPTPNEFEREEDERYNALQHIVRQKMENIIEKDQKEKSTIIPFGANYPLTGDEVNMLMGRRNSRSGYPEQAKNNKEFQFYEKSGFKEYSDSGLLYKVMTYENLS